MSKNTPYAVNPLITFTDLEAGLKMMIEVFGFVETANFRDENGKSLHVELTWGDTVVMPSERTDTIWSSGPVPLFLSTSNPDLLHEKATAAGLEIVQPLTDQDYGSREFACRDADGNVWIFGTYRAGQH